MRGKINGMNGRMYGMTNRDPREKPVHPGKVEVFDVQTGALLRTYRAGELPEGELFQWTKDDGWVAITTILEERRGAMMSTAALAADGRVLRRGMGPARSEE